MRNTNRGRTAGALKRATPLMKYQYMNRYLDLKETIAESIAAPAPNRSIEDELSKLEFLQGAKARELKWAQTRKDSKSACVFCKLAIGFHKQELSIRDQILITASIQPEIAEAHRVSDRFNFEKVKEVRF